MFFCARNVQLALRVTLTRNLHKTPPAMDKITLQSKFRGCLMGALMGDCLGAPFEGDPLSRGAQKVVQNYFDKLEEPEVKGPYKPYTDDTAMTKSVIKCLCDKPAVDYAFLARLFVKEYFAEPHRGYGANVTEVFQKLKSAKFSDIYAPARQQFGGAGSYGNGAAMRTAPIALYFHDDEKAMLHAARKCAEITHANALGVHGAILQCLAVKQSVMAAPERKINVREFCVTLVNRMKAIERHDNVVDDDDEPEDETCPYQLQMRYVQHFLLCAEKDRPDDEEIVKRLGTSIAALHSVPTAIYCFLRAQAEIPGIKTDNVFRRTIQYAISLGGDTDTIASMAGAIAGAYLGAEAINENLQKHCEFRGEMLEMADNLFTKVVARSSGETALKNE